MLQIFFLFELVSSVGQSLFSLDCLIVDGVNGTIDNNFVNDALSIDSTGNTTCTVGPDVSVFDPSKPRSFYATSAFLAALPVLALIVSALFWYWRYRRYLAKFGKRRRRSFTQFFAVTNIVVLFILYPTLSRTALKFVRFAFYFVSRLC